MKEVHGTVLNYCGYVPALGGGMHRVFELDNGELIDCEDGLLAPGEERQLEKNGIILKCDGLEDITRKELLELRCKIKFYTADKLATIQEAAEGM